MSIPLIRSCGPPSADPLSLVALLRFGILRQTNSLAPPPFSNRVVNAWGRGTEPSDCIYMILM